MRISNNTINNNSQNKIQDLMNKIKNKSDQISSFKKANQYYQLEEFHTKSIIRSEIDRNTLIREKDILELEKNRLISMGQVLSTMQKPMVDIENIVSNIVSMGPLNSLNPDYVSKLNEVQSYTYAYLVSIKANLNEMFNTKFLFGGESTRNAPINIPSLDTLEKIQSHYDGVNAMAPKTEAAHLYNTEIRNIDIYTKIEDALNNTNKIKDISSKKQDTGKFLNRKINNNGYLTWSFQYHKEVDKMLGHISLSNKNDFANLNIGSTLLINSSIADYSGVYKIINISGDGKSLIVDPAPKDVTNKDVRVERPKRYSIGVGIPETTVITLNNAGNNNGNYNVTYMSDRFYKLTTEEQNDILNGKVIYTTGRNITKGRWNNVNITSNSYYNGNEKQHAYKINKDNYITLGVNAQAPSIEKAIRAATMIVERISYKPNGDIDSKKMYARFKKILKIIKSINNDGYILFNERNQSLNQLKKNLDFQIMKVDNMIKINDNKIKLTENTTAQVLDVDLVKTQMEIKKLSSILKHSLEVNNKILNLSNGERN